jgi:cysteine desulfurase
VADFIYLDNNSTTPTLPAVWEAMRPFLETEYGNPASAHRVGSKARKALENARERISHLLGAHADEVVFTSGATEANNIALFGLAGSPPGHVIVSSIEHPSVLEPMERLAKAGFEMTRLPVDFEGRVHVDTLQNAVRPNSRLVSVMLANHETGVVQPTKRFVDAVDGRAAFHCDATQAVGKIPVHFHELGVTTLSFSGHKFHGPKGIGALLVRRNTNLQPLTWGGHQQQGRRPGTEPVALVIGMTTALELWHADAGERERKVTRLRCLLVEGLERLCSPIAINGSTDGLPHTVNVSFPGCQADVLLIGLDMAGVACSTGSACSSGSLLPSPVLRAMHVSEDRRASAMRFSLSPLLSEDEVTDAVNRIAMVVNRLRRSDS